MKLKYLKIDESRLLKLITSGLLSTSTENGVVSLANRSGQGRLRECIRVQPLSMVVRTWHRDPGPEPH